ncbi:MAG TPA: flagellar hook-basal body complex protein FliE [Solirubrobacteraceae bacterium]|jgi:flagellar hook-basal body complex protein FliE|nr:flagellar hook-basal body complex protein FliE [Solirubrobacteraceae bacterium]
MIIPPIGGLGAGSSAASVGGLGQGAQAGTAAGAEPTNFGGALSEAISSLEQTQQNASGAAEGLAMGTASDPEGAVVTVEDAQLAMQLASQIRTKATEAAQSIFQTQV